MSQAARQDRFLGLIDEHRKILHKVSGAYCRDAADRQDLAQEIVVQLWRLFDRFDERLKFSTWMYRIALNVAISFHRSETRRRRDVVPAGEGVLEAAAAPPDASERDQNLRRLQRFIERLDPLDRALVILYLDGNSHETTAEILGISSSNVGTKIGRIKERLKKDWTRTA